MPPQRKVQGRIAPAKVSEEATALAGLLTAEPDAASARGRALVETFSLAPRMCIFKELGGRLRGTPTPHPVPAIIALFETQRTGLKPAQEPEYAAAVLELALWCRSADASLAEELVYERIVGGGPGDALSLAPDALPAALASDPRLVASAARALDLVLRREKLSEEVLRRWADLIDPLIRPNQSGITPMQEGAAGDLLRALGAVPPERIPPELLVTAVRLAANCPTDEAGKFYGTAIGNQVLRWLRVPVVTAAPAPGETSLHLYKDRVRTRLQQVLDEVFVDSPMEQVNPNPPPPVTIPEPVDRTREVEAMKASVSLMEQERDSARVEAAKSATDLAATTKRLGETLTALTAAKEEAERWKSESKRRESELGGQFRVEQQQENQRHSRLISPPLREVCDHLARLLKADRRNEPLRRLAVSFDSLQKNLGRVLGTTDIQRLPPELLARPEEGLAADEATD